MAEGRPPNAAEKAGFEAATEFAPAKSLLRIQELAKFVFGNVAVVGTLLTGLGLFTDLGEVLEDAVSVGGAPLPLLLLGLSLICAIGALMPKMSDVDPLRLDEVMGWYSRQIKRRGIFVILSLSLFGLAIGTAALAVAFVDAEPEDPSISASWTGAGDEAALAATVELAELPEDATSTTTIVATAGGRDTELFRAVSRPDADGKLKVEATVATESFERAKIVSKVEGEGHTGSASLMLHR